MFWQDELEDTDMHGVALVFDNYLARSRRAVERCLGLARLAERSADPRIALGYAVKRITSLIEVERLIALPVDRQGLGRRLEDIAAAIVHSSDVIAELRTTIPADSVPVPVPGALIAIVCEALKVVEDCADAFEGVAVSIDIECREGMVVFDLRTGPGVRSALSRVGSGALIRLSSIAAAWGGSARRTVENGRLRVTSSMCSTNGPFAGGD